ncbi:hypothetical protein AAF712_009626 [Marasmius tenuissimus]|uniref:Uncharacterized protein n=1 Tax=Marasmius tenuissimus TaxID=585030 RepID=A0ABR2ZP34_9AGAR
MQPSPSNWLPQYQDKAAAIEDFERTNGLLANERAPLNIAEVANVEIDMKYRRDYWLLLCFARNAIERKFPPLRYPIPSDGISFPELVVHTYILCLSECSYLKLPSATSMDTIFPAYSTLETYQDDILHCRSPQLRDWQYLREENNPGITSLFVLPFLKMLGERKEDPLVVLAMHMQVLSYSRYTPDIAHKLLWFSIWDGVVCKEEMDEFLGSREVAEWFNGQPQGEDKECVGRARAP